MTIITVVLIFYYLPQIIKLVNDVNELRIIIIRMKATNETIEEYVSSLEKLRELRGEGK
ncbi:MAG: hypothetical protein QXT64_04955 [Desulfurococcaceae archaeon]